MMTPRSIQSAFFVGFWLLVGTGAVQLLSGFLDLVRSREAGATAGSVFSTAKHDFSEASRFLPRLGLPLAQPDDGPPASPAAETTSSTAGFAPAPDDAESTETLEDLFDRYGDQFYDTVMTSFFKRLPDVYPEGIGDSTDEAPWYAKILRGILMMVFGPLALRFACESIILFFRMNETLTDITRQLETANRRRDEQAKQSAKDR